MNLCDSILIKTEHVSQVRGNKCASFCLVDVQIQNTTINVKLLVTRLSDTSKGQEKEKSWERREAGGAQYRPIMKSLDRPAPRGRHWEFLIGGKKEVGVAHISAGEWPERDNKKQEETTARQGEGRENKSVTTGVALVIPSPPELHIGSVTRTVNYEEGGASNRTACQPNKRYCSSLTVYFW